MNPYMSSFKRWRDLNGLRIKTGLIQRVGKLDSYFVLDLSVARPLGRGRQVFLQVENILDETYEVGRSSNGIVTTGTPRLVHGGLRIHFE